MTAVALWPKIARNFFVAFIYLATKDKIAKTLPLIFANQKMMLDEVLISDQGISNTNPLPSYKLFSR